MNTVYQPFLIKCMSCLISLKPMTVAVHMYTPKSASLTALNVKVSELPSMRRDPCLVQMMAGAGLPSTLQVRVATSSRSAAT